MSGYRALRASLWVLGLLLIGILLSACERPAKQIDQTGYRGTGKVNYQNPRKVAAQRVNNSVPASSPPAPAVGPPAGQVYQNLQVLGGLSVPQFARLMLSITAWVSPQQGCNYCHEGNNLASDAVYTKVVARRMLEMTQHINADWKNHVAQTGVTCWTCHRGQPVPGELWFQHVEARRPSLAGNNARQNRAAGSIGLTSLPLDPFDTFLLRDTPIPVTGTAALPHGNRHSIKQTEWTFSLMVHMSESLGVNCTYCHNSRAFNAWEESRPQRLTAWHGIRMVRDLNNQYLDPLKPVYPAHRLGPAGDAPKLNCATCHQGVYKPLFGTSMLADHAELAAPIPPPPPPADPTLSPPPEETPVEVPSDAPSAAQTGVLSAPAG